MTERYRFFLEISCLFMMSLLFFLWGQAGSEVVAFESRFYLFALEMWRHGATFFPTTYQHFYPDYPATSTIFIYSFAKLFGTMNKLIAVLPSAIAAAITLVVTYAIAALHSKRWGIAAVFFLLLTLTFLKSARSITLDVYPTMITVMCFYLLYSADLRKKTYRLFWIYPLLILGFAFRGPIGLIIPAGVIFIYYLTDLQWKKCLIHGFLAFLLLCLCSAILLAVAYHLAGFHFMQSVLKMQVLGRMDDSHIPLSFYFTQGVSHYALSFPFALITFFSVCFYAIKKQDWMHDEIKLLFKLAAFILIVLLGMSIPGDKKIRYILPIVPALSLIAAYPYARLLKEKEFLLVRILTHLFLYLPVFFILLTEIIFYYSRKHAVEMTFFPVVFLLLFLQCVNIWLFYRGKKELSVLSIATLSFICTYVTVIEPIILYTERARDFVHGIEAVRDNTHSQLIFYKEKPDGLPIKYIIHTKAELRPLFVESYEELKRFKQPALFVSTEKHFAEFSKEERLHFEIIGKQKMGHVNVVVFRRDK